MVKGYGKDQNGRGLPAPAPPGQYEQTTLASLAKSVLLLKHEDLECRLSPTGGTAVTTRVYGLQGIAEMKRYFSSTLSTDPLTGALKTGLAGRGGFQPQGEITKKFRRTYLHHKDRPRGVAL